MTLSRDKIIERARENLETADKPQEREQLEDQELILKLQLELVQTKQKLTQEKQRNLDLQSKLNQWETNSQPLTLKRIPSLEEIAKQKYPSMADDLVNTPCPKKRLKICIVTQDIFGPIRNGGIGTAFYQLANLLADSGHDVTVLYSLGNRCENHTIDYWVEYYAERNITFVPVPEPKVKSAQGPVSKVSLIARKVYEYLKYQSFDIIHASDWRANCFYVLLAKKLGLAFQNTVLCIRPDSPSLWNTNGNNHLVKDPNQLLLSYLERKSVEWADIVFSPSLHLLHWMERHGYDLPKDKCYVQPYAFPVSEEARKQHKEIAYLKEVKELVFFGRLEPRKGIQIFCKALTRLEQEGGINCKVVFLGKDNKQQFNGEEYIKSQAKNWSFEWEIISDRNSMEAREYLKQNNRLAIIASLLDNSPLVVYECLADRIPLLCSDRGGTPELIHEDDKDSVVFPIHPGKLAKRLRHVVDNGVVIARPKFDFQDNLDTYAKWHLAIAHNPLLRLESSNLGKKIAVPATPKNSSNQPLVSVCLAHFNRPHELSQAIESLHNQTYSNYEVTLVDDGSDKPEAIAYLDSLEEDFATRNWKIIRQENLYTGAVRNTGVRNSKGEYILFMDDDNCAKPHEIETFVAAALHSGADVLTCFADCFKGKYAPKPDSAKSCVTPIGDCFSYGLLSGMLANPFGDTNALVKREFFDSISGFTEDYGVGLEDKEFFARAVLQGGKLLVVPESLYWYRLSEERVRNKHFDLNAGSWRVFRPYMDSLPWAAHDVMRLAMGLFEYHNRTKGKAHALKNLTQQVQTDISQISSILTKKK